ncbi:extracellular solute-binding protein [Acutalibacter sp. 1XD8-36]|nr:extracellular solute-binding protein [Acutalibacter sp. 1XD8-36]
MTKTVESNLRRVLVLSFIFLILISFFGCGRKTVSPSSQGSQDTQATAEQMEEKFGRKVITVLMDLPIHRRMGSDELQKSLAGLSGYEQDFMVLTESIPENGVERSTALTRIRTEIMAGKGPDLFICAQRASIDDTPFFNFPVKAMSNHIFMQLDDYIEKAEYMEWDKLQPVVMAAGKNSEGQQILPLTYTFNATFFDNTYTPENQLPMAWEEMIGDQDLNIRVSACFADMGDIIGSLADYDKDIPAFSEDELKTLMAKQIAACRSIPEKMAMEERPPMPIIDLQNLSFADISLEKDQEYTIIPAYNLSGGITANITTFAAINRNTRYPDEAFRIIDYLLSAGVQQTSPIFQDRMEGLPVYVDTGNESTPSSSAWKMNETNFKQIYEAQKQINIAKFPGPLDMCIKEVRASRDDKELEKKAHEQYVLMEMLLAES